MKSGTWTAFVFVAVLVVMIVLDLPFYIFLVVGVPVFIYVLTYASFRYSFRDSLRFEPIPDHGYRPRMKIMDREMRSIQRLGFHKIDQFYFKMIPDSITYVFKHKTEPIYLCLYHLGKIMTCDIFTRYADDITLTTTNAVEGGMPPRPAKNFLQVFNRASYEHLYIEHKKAHQYLTFYGARVYDIPPAEFRYFFMKSLKDQERYIRNYFLWPAMLVGRTIAQSGKKYCSPISEQYPEGTLNLYEL